MRAHGMGGGGAMGAMGARSTEENKNKNVKTTLQGSRGAGKRGELQEGTNREVWTNKARGGKGFSLSTSRKSGAAKGNTSDQDTYHRCCVQA